MKLFGPVAEIVTPGSGFLFASTRVPWIKVGVAAEAKPAKPKSEVAIVANMIKEPTPSMRLERELLTAGLIGIRLPTVITKWANTGR